MIVMPQDVFTEEQICELLPDDKICWLENLFEAIGYGWKNKIDKMMEGLKP